MDNDLKQQILSDLSGAATMVSQAIERLHPSLKLTKELRELDDQIATVVDAIEDGVFDK